MAYNRYPLSMHKGQWPGVIQSEYVYDEENEKRLADLGYSPKAPWVPDGPEVAPVVQAAPAGPSWDDFAALSKRIEALEAKVEKLEQQKRGPGRPPKEESR